MPVWHEAAKQWMKDGKLVLLGVTQEQHPERCRLFAQWKQFGWPILHDPINVLESTAVPIVTAIDEHGIVRSTRPNPKTLESEFLSKLFAEDAKNTPERLAPVHPPKFEPLRMKAKSAASWRTYGDALALWGDDMRVTEAITAYREAVKVDAKNGPAWFRLGVMLRQRSELPARQPDDFRQAVLAWGTALELDPNQYIWRRRIQLYGPRLDKPYPFYDWVPEAEQAIRQRGQKPIVLTVRPDGAEFAKPAKEFPQEQKQPKNPDPEGKVTRDTTTVLCEVVTVPAKVKPGQSVRVHLTFRLAAKTADHWNNEAEPLQVWLDPPDGAKVSERLLQAERPKDATSTESRTVGVEVQIPSDAKGTVSIPAFAVFHLCDDVGGQCRFRRLDLTIEVPVK